MKNIFNEEKVRHLGFGMNHPYFNQLKMKEVDINKIRFCNIWWIEFIN